MVTYMCSLKIAYMYVCHKLAETCSWRKYDRLWTSFVAYIYEFPLISGKHGNSATGGKPSTLLICWYTLGGWVHV